MEDKEFKKLVLKELKNINSNIWNLQTDVSSLKTDVSSLKTDASSLKTDVSELKVITTRIDNNNSEIKQEMSEWFEYVNKNINQAFEKISENIEYQDKVDDIVKILKNPRKLSPKSRFIAQTF